MTAPRVVSVNVGAPRALTWAGSTIESGIFKEPVAGRVAVRTLGLDGDKQVDLRVHGGPRKAVYAYPLEHLPFWRERWPMLTIGFGTFGENLSTEGLLETEVRIGDRFRIGTALLEVTQPREPCFKLMLKLGRSDAIETMRASRRSGFYLAVIEEGALAAGDPIELVARDAGAPTVDEAFTAR